VTTFVTRNLAAHCRWALATAALLACTLGCNGRARLELVSLDLKAIDPPSPHVTPVKMQECYWWTDDDGQVWIAMQRTQTPLLAPKFRLQFELSLALPRLPAGKARNYPVTRRELRARLRFGPWEGRFNSLAGIVALYRESGNKLRGSMRIRASRVSTRLLGGWSDPSRYLLSGSFVAVHDERRGRAIVESTESSGWDREPRQRSSVESP
jgi:hypothetical protein